MASRKPLLIALALGVLASSVVSAQPSAVSWPNVVLKYATDGTPLLHPRVPLASSAAGGGAATLNATQRLGIGSASANLNLTRNVPLANLAKVARVAAWGLGPIMLGSLALSGLQWAADHWEVPGDDGPTPGYLWRVYDGPSGSCGGFTGCTWATIKAEAEANCPGTSGLYFCNNWSVIQMGSPQNLRLMAEIRYVSNGNYAAGFNVYTTTVGTNPDPPEGVPATASQLEDGISAALSAQPILAGQVLDLALSSSEARAELVADAMAVTGPATVDGGTTTSTRVETAGTTTIQTQRTYNLSYQGDTVYLTQTQVETVTDPANNVTTTTTTTDAPTGDPPPPEDPPDLCADNPDASGCAPFGTPEPPTPLPQEDRTVSVAPEMSAAGACPAPQAFSIAGQSFQLTYDGACEFAQGIRPVVLAVAWMGAFVFLFSIGRAQTS